MATSAGVRTKLQIPFFRYPHLFNQQRDEIHQAVTGVMERGAYILQSGRIIREGTPGEIAADPQVRQVYLGENFQLR